MNKLDIKKHLIEEIVTEVHQNDLNYSEYLHDNDLDTSEVNDLGEQSQSDASAEFSNELDVQSHIHKKNLELIKSISFEPSSVVELGAIVETKNIFLIIAASSKPFKYDNKKFVSVSVDAPLYQCLKGKSAGDECTYNGTKFTIKNIY